MTALTGISAPDFETGFPDTRPHWSQVRRLMLDGVARFVNTEMVAEAPEAEETIRQIQRGLERVAAMKDLVSFRDQYGDAWKQATRDDDDRFRQRALARLARKIYELGASK